MGKLVEGVWHDVGYDTKATGGRFERDESRFRNWVTATGEPGPSGSGGFKAETNRYHLYISLACPWAHRTLIFRTLKGLKNIVPVSVVDPLMLENGWEFHPQAERTAGATGDDLFGSSALWEIYVRAASDYTGRVTVPVLWDKKAGTIVSNESAEIIRMFNVAFNDITGNSDDYYPDDLHEEIDTLNSRIYDTVNNGVYKAGFATAQGSYEENVVKLFETLDMLENSLASRRFLCGDRLTEADWRLFTTLVRFDAVYVGHFKCNIRRIADFTHLSGYLRDLYQWPGIAETVDFQHIKQHYYRSHKAINPTGIVPVGPDLNLDAPHDRDTL